MNTNIKFKRYAGRDIQGKLTPWTFERRAFVDIDILIDIEFSDICYSNSYSLDWFQFKGI